MLTEGQRQLLTAYVDGELSEPQRRRVQRLLERSSEARRLLERLEADASALRGLTTPSLDRDLVQPVLDIIAWSGLDACRRRPAFRRATFPVWTSVATAAAVLLVLGSMTYLYFSAAARGPRDKSLAAQKGGRVPKAEKTRGPVRREAPQPAKAQDAPRANKPSPPPAPPEPPPLPAVAKKEPHTVNPPREKSPDVPAEVIAAPSMERFELTKLTLHLPTVLPLHGLDHDPARARLLDELAKGSLYRVELPCSNAARAFERLAAAGNARHFAMHVDALAQALLKFPRLRAHYGFFAEDLLPDEVVRLLLQLDAEDRKGASSKPPAEAQFESAILARLSAKERKELLDLLGFDPGQPIMPRSPGPLGIDPSRPLPGLTASQVSESLAGQGRPQPGKALSKPTEHHALVTVFGVPRARGSSAEIKRFQELRKPARPGTVQVLLVLRHTGI